MDRYRPKTSSPFHRPLFLGFGTMRLLGLLLLALRFTGLLLFFAQLALLLGILRSRFFTGLFGLVRFTW
ncbi:hypothetical protein C7H85_03660 [Zobellella endophytica]|uniref:Uncharacterized protein n=1 Tax=Zobellella endophytica TaxID=2116700 RepID=A0A2P7RCF1_9GAMM|nr:hypothetical protein C7H85_03660 [Zobellella endophytica]